MFFVVVVADVLFTSHLNSILHLIINMEYFILISISQITFVFVLIYHEIISFCYRNIDEIYDFILFFYLFIRYLILFILYIVFSNLP